MQKFGSTYSFKSYLLKTATKYGYFAATIIKLKSIYCFFVVGLRVYS